jgi:four helix bundle protein
MQTYKELIVWQRSVSLVTEIYKATETFPKTEVFSLTNQIRRAATSIPANIAEGNARGHRKEYVQFLKIAFGSGAELETHLIVAQNLGYLNQQEAESLHVLLSEVMRMMNKLISSLVPSP